MNHTIPFKISKFRQILSWHLFLVLKDYTWDQCNNYACTCSQFLKYNLLEYIPPAEIILELEKLCNNSLPMPIGNWMDIWITIFTDFMSLIDSPDFIQAIMIRKMSTK